MVRRSRMRHVVLAVTALTGLAVAAATVGAAPARGGASAKERPILTLAPDEPVPGAPAEALPAMVGMRRAGLLNHPEVKVEVALIDKGVAIHVTSQNPELVKQIQTQLGARLEWLKEMPKQGPGAPKEGAPGLRARPMQRLLEGANITTDPRDDGLTITVTSDKPEDAQAIKNVLPKRIEAMRHFAAGTRALKESVLLQPRVMKARDFLNLLLAKDVSVVVGDTEKGVTLEFTSDDPEKVQKLREVIRDRMEALEELRQRLPEGPPTEVLIKEGEPARTKMGLAAPEHPAIREIIRQQLPPHLVVREVRPAEEAALREIIREEIRRYLEEQREE